MRDELDLRLSAALQVDQLVLLARRVARTEATGSGSLALQVFKGHKRSAQGNPVPLCSLVNVIGLTSSFFARILLSRQATKGPREGNAGF